MKWSPPRIQPDAGSADRGVFVAAMCLALSLTGCASMQQLRNSVVSTDNGPSPNLSASPFDSAKATFATDDATPRDDTGPFQEDNPVTRVAKRAAPATILAPRPFVWNKSGRSAGDRAFQELSVGDAGFRTLVAGSIGGNDPTAIALVEQLARRLHEDSLILGGFQTRIIRTLNPDGEANRRFTNQAGTVIYQAFPSSPGANASVTGSPPEIEYFRSILTEQQPQRVIHVRTVAGDRGLISADSQTRATAREVAEWLNFRSSDLSETSKPGSLEFYAALENERQVITFGIPATASADTVWEQYGDALMNLLLSEDLATRELARGVRRPRSSAQRPADPVAPQRPATEPRYGQPGYRRSGS